MSIPPPFRPRETAGWSQALAVLPIDLQRLLLALDDAILAELEEVRLRVGQPIELRFGTDSQYLKQGGGLTMMPPTAAVLSQAALDHAMQQVTQFSLYAVEDELRKGFITLPGGHRIGVAYRIVTDGGHIRSIRSISSLNIRIARAYPGMATPLRSWLADRADGHPLSTLVISPPQCGKTTLVRDIARQWSENLVTRRRSPAKVVVIDERSEIAGMFEGRPQFALGPRTDVLDGCPKAEGLLMAIRSLSPDIVVTDEIGKQGDVEAVLEAANAGVAVITTAHASSLEGWRRRPHMEELFQAHAFARYVILSRRRGPGTIECVLDGDGRSLV
ncbi:stage III sporulation protein AA [Alicyclobacillus sacchari]|uniref:stage III sporulation protein AA n=1 Tax=Alicyclobacillus sacchari TaxID=392010 RepID=UPI0023E90B51|nr:stage III sporulation protein AA [Alicyclobacillus sacchari]GMA55864.1 stage III sporulation protein AA [Alicyclobacillus sacchari]